MPDTKRSVLMVRCPRCGVNRPFGHSKKSGKDLSRPSDWRAGVARQSDGSFDMTGFCQECDTKIVFKLNPAREADAKIIAHYIAAVGVPGVPIDNDEMQRRAERAVQFRGKSPVVGNVSVTLPLEIYTFFYGKKYTATYNAPDNVVYNGVRYSSVSMAAREVAGGVNKNGWLFWSFTDPESGEAVPLNAIRSDSERNLGPVGNTRRRMTLPGFDDRFSPVERPNQKLPVRNRQGLCAEYFVDLSMPDSGKIIVYLYVAGELGRIVYVDGKVRDSKKFGIYNSWNSCKPVVSHDAFVNGYARVRVNDGGYVPYRRNV